MRRDLLVIEDPDADCVKIPRCVLLDAPSEPHPILDALLHHELRDMYLLADGKVMSYTHRPEKVTKGGAGTRAPVSSLAREIDELLFLYGRCRTHRERLRVLWFAQKQRRSTVAGPAREKINGTPEWRAAVAAASGSLRAIARVYGTSYQTVRRIKMAAVTPVADSATLCHDSEAA